MGELLMKSLSEIKVYYSVFGFIFGRYTKGFSNSFGRILASIL